MDDLLIKEYRTQSIILGRSIVFDPYIKNLMSYDKKKVFELFQKSASFKNINMGILKTAIFSYWEKNYSVSAVLFSLIIENLIRNTVQENGGIVITPINLKKLVGYEYSSINKLLEEKDAFCKKIGDILGTKIIFHLKIILISKFGQNWRNKTMHGIPANKYEESIKSLWLFHTLCLFLLIESDNDLSTENI